MPSSTPIPGAELPADHHHHVESHRSHRAGWLRAAVLGANDGVVSTAALIVGVASSGASTTAVRTAGIAGLVAGAMSMAAGEYVLGRVAARHGGGRPAHGGPGAARAPACRARGAGADLGVARPRRPSSPRRWHASSPRPTPSRPTPATSSGSRRSPPRGPCRPRRRRPLAFSLGAAIPLLAYLVAPSGRSAVTIVVALPQPWPCWARSAPRSAGRTACGRPFGWRSAARWPWASRCSSATSPAPLWAERPGRMGASTRPTGAHRGGAP